MKAAALPRAHRRRFILAVALCSWFAVAPAAAEPNLSLATRQALDSVVLPGFSALAEASAALAEVSASFCATPDTTHRVARAAAFHTTLQRWGEIGFIRTGPLSRDGRQERFAFSPDPRGIVARQTRMLVAQGGVSVGLPIAERSAAVQGLPALELLLTEPDYADPGTVTGRAACDTAVAIAGNLADIARTARAEWTGWRLRMLTPGSDNAVYPEIERSAGDLLRAAMTGLQIIVERQLPADDAASAARPPYSRSDNAFVYSAACVRGAARLLQALRLADFLPRSQRALRQPYAAALHRLARTDGDAPPRPELRRQLIAMRGAVQLTLGPAAGLTLGFNELDGD